MIKYHLVTFLALLALSSAAKPAIENVVVLMLENRAFDHMLGFLKRENAGINGLNGDEFNRFEPNNINSPKVTVNDRSGYIDPNYGHSFEATRNQVFGYENNTKQDPAPMNGFVKAAEQQIKGSGVRAMDCFNSKTVPVISTLAKEFALFDMWFASHPGPTEVNRAFVHSATSNGMVNNDLTIELIGFPQNTIYHHLLDKNVSWRLYMEEITTTLFFAQMRQPRFFSHFRPVIDFFNDAKLGRLPSYSFIEPRYFAVPFFEANDQHPDHNVALGELLIKEIYEAVRSSPQWNKTALIITYDEHGGFFDHVPPPMKGVPNPDGVNSTEPAFDFTRLGVRVPAIICSPLIPKGTLIHRPPGPLPTSQYDHTSILSFVKNQFNLPKYLTKRDEWAGTFDHVFSLNTPRTDCPTVLPNPPQLGLRRNVHEQPLNDLQLWFIKLMDLIATEGKDFEKLKSNLKNEEAGSIYLKKHMKELFGFNN
jgi:phospholipase C